MSKPRIKPKKHWRLTGPWYECHGIHPSMKIEGWAYGRSIQEAYQNWLDDPLPF